MLELDKNEKKRVAIYCRVSTDEQAINGTSLNSQKDSLIEYVEIRNKEYTLDKKKHIYIDGGHSGGNDNRPELNRMMLDVKNGNIDVVLVYKIDRFFRKTLLLLQYIEDLKDNEVGFKSITENFDTTGIGKVMIGFLGLMAEFERDMIRDRTVLGKLKKAKSGYYVGGAGVKFGYQTVRNNVGVKLKIDKEESIIVNRIFDMFVNDNKSIGEICKILTSENIPTKYDSQYKGKEKKLKEGQKPKKHGFWHSRTVREILNEEMYIGKYYYGKTYKKVDRKTRKDVIHYRVEGDPLLVTMECPKILLDEEVFYKSLEKLEKNKVRKNGDNNHNFTGFIKCGKCGSGYVGYKTSKATFSYRCRASMSGKKPKDQRCDNNEISEVFIIDYVWDKLNNLFKKPDKILEDYYKNVGNELKILGKHNNELIKVNNNIEINSNGLISIYEEYHKEIDENIKNIIKGTIISFKSKIKILNSRKEELVVKIGKLTETEKNKANIKKVTTKFKNKFKNKIDENKKLEIIKEFIDKIEVKGDGNVVIGLKFFNGNNSEQDEEGG